MPSNPRRASLNDLAQALGLSPSTVSRALVNHPDVSEATKKRAHLLADQLNYHPNPLAAGLRRGHTNTLGVIVPHITGYFFAQVIEGIISEARAAGFTVMVCQSDDDAQHEAQAVELLLMAQVAGILVSRSDATQDYAHFEAVREQGIPLVFFDRVVEEFKGPNVSSVTLNDYLGARQVVEHLIAQGCRRIAHLTGPLHVNIHRNRHQGYLDALQAAGLPHDPRLVVLCELSQLGGSQAMHGLLRLSANKRRPDGVFASNDLAAVGALQMARKRGLRVPEDLALAGFSNEVFTTLTEPPLTSVDQRGEQMGHAAVQLLQRMLPSFGRKGRLPRGIVLKPKLLVRESSLRHG